MTTRRVNLLLRTTSVVLALSGAGIVAGGWWIELPSVPTDTGNLSAGRPATRTGAALPALAELESVWNRRLRPSFGAVAVTTDAHKSVATTAGETLPDATGGTIALVGTIGDSIALIRDSAGTVEARQVGEAVAGAGIVVAVRPSEVDFKVNGQIVTLKRALNASELNPFAPMSMPPPRPEDEQQLGRIGEAD